jgi:hypothetical protein
MAHDPVGFVGLSFMDAIGNYQVRKRKPRGGTRRPDEQPRERKDLVELVDRAEAVAKRYLLEIGPAITDAHVIQSYFYRPGWDPQRFFT